MLFKMLIMMHLIFIWGAPKSTFSKYCFDFWEGGRSHKKHYSVYAFDNVDKNGRWQHSPITWDI